MGPLILFSLWMTLKMTKVLILGSNIISLWFTVTTHMVINDDLQTRRNRINIFSILIWLTSPHQYTVMLFKRALWGGKYCGSILLKCLCACVTHSAVRLSYENIMAIKWDCGIIPLHCLSPRGCAAVWELPSWTQTRQKWSLISGNILAERIRNQHQSLLPHQIFTSLWRLLLYLQAFLLTNKQSL